MNLEINVFVLLALLEVIFVIMGVGAFLWLKTLKQKRQLLDLELKLLNQPAAKVVAQPVPAKTEKPVAQKTFEDYLRLEIDNSNIMLGGSDGLERLDEEPVDENDEDVELRNILAMRHQFLQLELDAQALSKDPEAKRKHMLEGMRALIAALTPEPVQAEISPELADENARNRERQLQDQIEALRAAVNNQHDVMKELRRILKEHLGDSEEAKEIIAEIEKAEAEAEKLEASLAELTRPGGSIEAASGGTPGAFATVDAADTDMLKNLVGNQQNTINKLKHMLAEAIPDARAAEQLKQAVDKVQRSNQELGTCVMVLEDENSRLRTEVETLQEKIQDFETQPAPEAEPAPETEAEEVDVTESPVEAELDKIDSSGAETDESEEDANTSETVSAAPQTDIEDIDALLEEVAEEASKEAPVEDALHESAETPVDNIDALLDEATASEIEDETSAEEITAEDDIDALLEEASEASGPDKVDDIDALLEEESVSDPEGEAVSKEAEPVDDVDALLEEATAAMPEATEQPDESSAEAAVDEELPEQDKAEDDDIDALLDEVASKQPEEKAETADASTDVVASDDDDLDSLLQEVAAASQEAADGKEKAATDEAMDEVDALLAEIAADNKKSGG